ncbi:MAG TPA: MFS transporter [Candidatus Limnocylindrales bacterium]|nr:MFS transporter [Candidatus Limnocylindrales bacterium]
MRRVNAITFLNYFVSGALTLLIPLLLLAKHVNVAVIGLVLSILPLVFLVARLIFSSIADYVGWSHVFLLINWPSAFFSTLIYYFSSTWPFFALGKIVEALRESSYWAVSRTAIYHLSPNRAGHEATKMNGIIWIGMALGGAMAGLGIFYLGFSMSLLVLALVALAIGVPAVMLWRSSSTKPLSKTERFLNPLDPRGRSRIFWVASVALLFNSIATYPLVNLLLPIFMSQKLGYSYIVIGVLFMLYYAISAAATWLSVEKSLSWKRAAALTVASVVASIFLAVSGFIFPAALLILAFVRGYGVGFFEHTVLKVAKDSKNLSLDIGMLHAPMRLAEFSSLVAGGFIAQTLGYAPVFIACGVFMGVHLFMSLYVIKGNVVKTMKTPVPLS